MIDDIKELTKYICCPFCVRCDTNNCIRQDNEDNSEFDNELDKIYNLYAFYCIYFEYDEKFKFIINTNIIKNSLNNGIYV